MRALKRVQVEAALCLLVAVPGTCFSDGVLLRLPTGGIVILEGGIAISGALLCKLWLCQLLSGRMFGDTVRALRCAQVKAALCRRVAVFVTQFPDDIFLRRPRSG